MICTESLLQNNALADFSIEIKTALYALTETGARISEILNLSYENIHLDHEIPHIEICENETWKPKCAGDTRIIPLVGAALHAYQLMPSGHRGVFKKPDLFVNNVNKCLAKKGLIEKTDSIRSLRKQYETRLREAYVKDSLIHSITRIPPPIYTPCGLSLHERQMKKAPLIYLKISQFCMNKIKLDFTELMPC